MTIEAGILKNVEKLPESVKQAVLLYTEFLASQYAEAKPNEIEQRSNEIEQKPKKRRLAGSMKGTFVLPLPEDFNQSLDLTDAATQSEYEKKYGYGSLAGKIVMSDDFDEPLEDLKDYM